jgi:GH15 family glucan-1,4-alpha-glucosidase
MKIEDYAYIGDMQTGALVGRDGAVDWLCLPRFDSASCFAALVGNEQHGSWRLAPAGEVHRSSRRYRPDPERRTFTQYHGSNELDASVLTIPIVGFLPGSDDERVAATIDAISRELGRDGFVGRYSTAESDDGLPGDEGQFLACSFWLVSALALNGRADTARELSERLVRLTNDLGLLAEEYDVGRKRQVGNFPQAFSHLTLIGAAYAIATAEGDARSDGGQLATETELTR